MTISVALNLFTFELRGMRSGTEYFFPLITPHQKFWEFIPTTEEMYRYEGQQKILGSPAAITAGLTHRPRFAMCRSVTRYLTTL